MNIFTITKKGSKKYLAWGFLIFSLLFFQGLNCLSQEAGKYNLDELKGLFETHNHAKYRFSKPAANHVNNELDFIAASGFRFYKLFLSSQDNPSCIFYPSCSEYSIRSFQEKGLLLGFFYTFDRLSRCHRLVKNGEYIYDESKQRFYDPLK